MDRRTLLKVLSAAAGGAALEACATRSIQAPASELRRAAFAKVLVSPDRIIRSIAGLRPFRPSGFVVRGEKIGEKLCVHNYGHGGAGVTLSWGTASLAVEEAMTSGERRMAVLGCGAVGLATARLLQQRGVEITIYAKSLPLCKIASARYHFQCRRGPLVSFTGI